MKTRRDELRQLLTDAVMKEIDGTRTLEEEQLKMLIEETIRNNASALDLSVEERRRGKRDVFNALCALDVLQELMDDSEITEVMVNGPSEIFYERGGRLFRSDLHFSGEKKLEDVIQKIASGVNRVVNEANPILDARLTDGSRVNAVLPPISLDGAALTIRKFPKTRITMEKLVELGSISEEAAEYLKILVRAGYNIFVSGDNDIIGLSQVTSRTEKATAA